MLEPYKGYFIDVDPQQLLERIVVNHHAGHPTLLLLGGQTVFLLFLVALVRELDRSWQLVK
jgi:hypothetical protein